MHFVRCKYLTPVAGATLCGIPFLGRVERDGITYRFEAQGA